MTIPTRDEALAMLDGIPSDYQQVDELKARLRSYIESNTGEPAAWALSENQYDGVRDLVRNAYEHGCKDVDANYDPDDADPDFSEAAYDYAESVTEDFIKLFPSVASPVQPVLEWEPQGRLGSFGYRQLIFNGKVIGTYRKTTGYIGQPRADELEVMAGRNCKGDFLRQAPFLDWQTEADIEANMEQRARQWISGGDK